MELKNINIDERMEHYHVHGLSIALIHNGQISVTKGFGVLEAGTNRNVGDHSIFNACSISKFVTAMLVMKLTELDILHLDEDVNTRLIQWKVPENKFTQDKKVTLRTLLSHQSGVIDCKGSFGELDLTEGVPSIASLLEGKTSYCKDTVEIKYQPGSEFEYSDAGFCIIQQLIEDVTKKPFHVVMNELVFEPLNMKNSTYVQMISHVKSDLLSCGHHKTGNVVDGKYSIYPYPAAAGLWTTPSDLALLVIELMSSLTGKSRLGLSKSMVTEMITPQGCKEWAGLGMFLDGSNHHLEISSLGWGIGFQSMLVAYPYLETGAVIMTNADLGVHQLEGIIGEIYRSLK